MSIEAELFDGTIVEFPDGTDQSVIQSTVKRMTEERKPKTEEGFLRQAADVPVGFAKGVATGVRMIADSFGAENPVSQSIRGVEGYLNSVLSAQARKDQEEVSRIMKDAEDKGVLDQVMAGLKAFSVAPVDMLSQALGTAAPAIVGGLAGGVLRVGAMAAGAATGAAMGAGTIKGAIYDATKEELGKLGLPPEQIEAAAIKAQEYGGENLDQILLGAGLGGITSVTGIEGAIVPGLAKNILNKAGKNRAARALGVGAKEAIPEGFQGGQEQYAQNVALNRQGFDVDPFRGVAGQATLEATAGFGLGAGVGALSSPSPAAASTPVKPTAPQQAAPEQTSEPYQEPFKPSVVQPSMGVAEGVDYATGVSGQTGLRPEDFLGAGEAAIQPGQRERSQNLAAQQFGLNERGPRTEYPAIPGLNAETAQSYTDGDRFKQQTPRPEVTPAQTQPRTPTAPLNAEEMRKRIDEQSKILEGAKNEPFAFDRNRASAAADVAGGTGAVRGQPNAQLVDVSPMPPVVARQKLAIMQHDLVAQGGNPADLVIVPHPTMSGRFAIEQRNLNSKPYVAPPINTPTVSPAEAQQRIEASALQGSEQSRLAQDNPRQAMISRAMKNIEDRGGVASPYEAQLLREANMGQPFNSIDQGLPPPSGSLQGARLKQSEKEFQAELAAEREKIRQQGPNQPVETAPTVETPEAIEAERQARNKSDMAQQQRRLLELQQQRQAEQESRESAGAEQAAKPKEAPSPNEVITAFRTPAPLRSAEQVNLLKQAKEFMSPEDFDSFKRAGEEDFNILQRAANAPATMSMYDKARLNVIREGRASLKPEYQVATPEAKETVEDIKKKLLPMLRRFGLEKVGLRLVDSIENGTADGFYFKNLITLALDSDNPMGVMRHEVIHALKELGAFTAGEWKVLSNMAEKQWINQFFNQDMINRYQEIFLQENGSLDGFAEYMQEEAIAQAFRYYSEQKPPSGLIANLMRRLNKMFEAINNFFSSKGFKSGEDVFLAERILADIERGAITSGRAGVQSNAAPVYSLIRKAVPNETEISTQNPQGEKRLYDPIEDMLSIDEEALQENFKLNPDNKAAVIKAIKSYGFIPKDTPNSQAIAVFKQNIINNLLYLHDKVPAETRERSKLWYDGANRIAKDMARDFGVSMEQVAGIMAAMSPQKDWFQNVSMAERALDILTKQGNKSWDENTLAYAQSYVSEATDRADREKRQKAFDKIKLVAERGTTLDNMSPDDAAAFIRAYDEAFHSRGYRIVTPEGGFSGLVTKNDGNPATMMWSTYNPIKKTVLIYRDGSRKNISEQLGGEHKIRSFYNNIAAPNSDIGHVTIDTHAVAAALFEALAGTDKPVTHNFGGTGKSDFTGVGGTYGIIADAYREAAKRRGVKPREMQSITWEAIRGLFGEDIKSTIKPKIAAEWTKYRDGEQTFNETREKAVAIAKGIDEPDWKNSDRGQYVSEGGASYDKSFVPEGGVRLRTENEIREKLTFNLSAVTTSIPGLRNLYDLAMKGDSKAYSLLQKVAESHLKYLLGGTGARLNVEPIKGVYLSDREPSISVSIAFQESETKPVMAALAKFANSFNQQQIHVRQKTAEKVVGYEYGDGSYTTPVYTIELNRSLSNNKISQLIEETGLEAFSVSNDTLVAYYVKPDNSNDIEKDFNEFANRIKSAYQLVGKPDTKVQYGVQRLFVYGEGPGARLGYKSIGGNVRAEQTPDTNTPRLIANYLNDDEVETFKQKDLTKAQVKDQELLAKIFEELPVNDLKNPLVRRAYNALAKELVRQYRALPIKAEVITDNAGALYRNSVDMRKDVSLRNRLKIYQTTPDTFGPKGSNFNGHPLLRDSGVKDINGYPMLYNDVLRAVHDYFAHNLSATEFGPKGEFAAAKNHMAVTSDPLARWAIIAETRQQNAWQNFRPEVKNIPVKDRAFADQKASLPPIEFALTGNEKVDAPMREFIETLTPEQRLGSLPASSQLAKDFKGTSVKPKKNIPPSEKGKAEPVANEEGNDVPRFSLRQQKTPEFKQWFGNSKVVDERGNPKVMYHGTSSDITEFRPKQAGAIFVTDNPRFAEAFTDAGEHYLIKKMFNDMEDAEKAKILKKALSIAKKSKSINAAQAADVNDYIKTLAGSSFGMVPSAIEVELTDILTNALPSRGNIMPLYVSAENPFDYSNPSHVERLNAALELNDGLLYSIKKGDWEIIESPKIQSAIKAEGFDSFYVNEGGTKNLAVYNPNQIKSAIGNTGAFSKANGDIRFALKPLTKLSENEPTTGKAIIKEASDVIDNFRNSEFRTSKRVSWVDKFAGLSKTLSSLDLFSDGKLRADMLHHSKAQTINLIRVGLVSGTPIVNPDGTLGIERSDNNLARSAYIADQMNTNADVAASGMSGRQMVAEVARILRGQDILAEDKARNKLGEKQILEAVQKTKELRAAIAKGTTSPRGVAAAQKAINDLRKLGHDNRKSKRELQVTPEHIEWAKERMKANPEIQEVLDIWKAINTSLVNLKEETGLISAEKAQQYRDNKNYVPLFKSREDMDSENFLGYAGVNVKRLPKDHRLEGADIQRNVWENIDRQYAADIAAAYENQTRRISVEQMRGLDPSLAKLKGELAEGETPNMVYRENGKDIQVYIENPNDLAAFQSMTYPISAVMKFFSGASRVLRAGALLNPMFWLKQIIRDPISASITGQAGVVTPLHSAKEFMSIIMKNSQEARVLAERGVIGQFDSTVSLQEFLGDISKEKGSRGLTSRLLHKALEIHEASDAATRVAIYKKTYAKAIKDGMSPEKATDFAVFKARESINFALAGNSPTLNTVRQMIPFMNATIVGLDTLYRAATGYGLNPEEKAKVQKQFAIRATMLVGMTLAYAAALQDDEDYKKLPDYVKDGNWLFPTSLGKGKTFVKIPVPFEVGYLFKTLPELFVRYMSGTSTGKEVLASMRAGFIQNLPTGGTPIPQAFKPALEVWQNHSFFTNRPIEGIGDSRLPVAHRGEKATEFAKMLSGLGLDKINASPAKIDALGRGYFAEFYVFGTELADKLINAQAGKATPPKNLENQPFMKSFLTDPQVNKAVSDFYDLERNATEVANLFKKYEGEGNVAEMRKMYQNEETRRQIAAAPELVKFGKNMAELKHYQKFVENNQNMSPDERRAKMNEIQLKISQMAEYGRKLGDAMKLNR